MHEQAHAPVLTFYQALRLIKKQWVRHLNFCLMVWKHSVLSVVMSWHRLHVTLQPRVFMAGHLRNKSETSLGVAAGELAPF